MQARRNVLLGLVAVVLAALWVLRALDVFPGYLADLIGRSTPILLVLAGLSILLRGRVPFSEVLALLLSAGLIAGVGTTAYQVREMQMRDENVIEVAHALEDEVILLRVRLQSLATDVEITRAPTTEARTVRVIFEGSTERDLVNSLILDDETSATLTINEVRENPIPRLEAVGRGTMLVELPPEIPVDVQLEAVQGEVRMNLAGVRLERLNLAQQTGDAFVDLPAYDPAFSRPEDTLGTLLLANGRMTIRVPATVAARFDMSASTGGDPTYDPEEYNLLFARDILEDRNIDTAEIVHRYNLEVSRNQLFVTVPEDDAN
jgi:hypothetical protein